MELGLKNRGSHGGVVVDGGGGGGGDDDDDDDDDDVDALLGCTTLCRLVGRYRRF
jgi:hypothetical protein